MCRLWALVRHGEAYSDAQGVRHEQWHTDGTLLTAMLANNGEKYDAEELIEAFRVIESEVNKPATMMLATIEDI